MSLERQYRRYRVTDLQGNLQFAHPATVIDLSRSGVAVESAERLVPGRTYPLQIEGSDGLLITTSARVVWCRITGTAPDGAGEQAPVYRAGLEFQGVLPDPAKRLFDRLEQSPEPRVDTRIVGQHKPGEPGSRLLLHDQATFEVRTLSRRGMDAEMTYMPHVGSFLEFVLPLGEPLELRGRVTDVTPAAEDPQRFLVGIEFAGVPARSQGQLDRYVDALHQRSPDTEST